MQVKDRQTAKGNIRKWVKDWLVQGRKKIHPRGSEGSKSVYNGHTIIVRKKVQIPEQEWLESSDRREEEAAVATGYKGLPEIFEILGKNRTPCKKNLSTPVTWHFFNPCKKLQHFSFVCIKDKPHICLDKKQDWQSKIHKVHELMESSGVFFKCGTCHGHGREHRHWSQEATGGYRFWWKTWWWSCHFKQNYNVVQVETRTFQFGWTTTATVTTDLIP